MFQNLDQMIDQALAFQDKSLSSAPEGWVHAHSQPYPKINLYQTEDQLIITAELPGLKQTEVDLSVQADHLVLSAAPDKNHKEPSDYLHRERGVVAFKRKIPVGYPIDPARVRTQYQDGVLTVFLVRNLSPQSPKIAFA